MRAGPLALSAASAAVVLVTVPVATAPAADRGGSVSVSPSAVAPGTDVDLRVSGCEGTTGRARSGAFVSPGVLAPDADRPALIAEARVGSATAAGTYPVEVTCGGARIRGSVRVLAPGGAPAPTPTALVHAGGGGAAAQLAAHPAPRAVSEGPGTRHAVIGLVLTAIAAVAVAFRSVRRRRSTR